MHFCPNCGKQYENHVSFCVVCGNPVVAAPAPAPAHAPVATPNYVTNVNVAQNVAEGKKPFLHTLFAFIAKIIQIFTGFSLGMAIAECYLDLEIGSGYYGKWSYGWFEPNYDWALVALIASSVAICASVVAFIFSLVKKTDLKTKFSKIVCMTLSVALFVLSCVFMAKS